jgi:RimJ/RimL family protein N-acetyltransferase
MEFSFQQMNQTEAEEIANQWRYDGIYSFYDISADEDDYLEFVDSEKRGNRFFSCYAENELVGYYSVEIHDGKAEFGLGLKPELTGKGVGVNFINAVLEHIATQNDVHDFTLSVALFNERAIKAYEAVGFVRKNTFLQNTNGSTYEFLRMDKFQIRSR